tara:strand:+ start:9213 stop:10376 length:1164 start_codon:yes stop_codon:yes gene_type:complete
MATDKKQLSRNDIVYRKTLLHEHIPITGSLVSGTYQSAKTDVNIKNYSHGMFQSIYDYPYLSSSSNHLFDITCGYSSKSSLSSSTNSQNAKKINIYNQMAQVLAGYDRTGSILRFVKSAENIDSSSSTEMGEAFFLTFSRLLTKDEIKKGSFALELGVWHTFEHANGDGNNGGQTFNQRIKITDASGSNSYKVDSPAGEYGVLYATGSTHGTGSVIEGQGNTGEYTPVGLIYYQAGVAVISGSVFGAHSSSAGSHNTGILSGNFPAELAYGISGSGYNAITGSTIQTISDGVRNRVYNVQFNNTTELNSSIYFCRVNHNEFNYSSNPTFTSGSQVVVKDNKNDSTSTYITTVGLYNAQNEMLATAKLSEPLKKTPEDELTLRVRLDY